MDPRGRPPIRPAGLPFRNPKLGRDYWLQDNCLPNPREVVERCYSRTSWDLGAPYRNEVWPGMRSPGALLPEELAKVEQWVKAQTGAKELFQRQAAQGFLNHNFVQLVGQTDSTAKPHVDSLELCTFAGVIYLHPNPPPKQGGTSFFRLRLPNGTLGGNICPPPFANLPQALGTRRLPADAFVPIMEIENVFNRLVVYRSDMIHSATSYFGSDLRSKRMTALFFWKASF